MIPLTKLLADKKANEETIMQLQGHIILLQDKIRKLEVQNAKLKMLPMQKDKQP